MESPETLADKFFHAFYNKEWPGERETNLGEYSIAESYEIQDRVVQKRIEAGDRVAGFKVGCTSTAIRTQFGLTEPICARIFHPYIFEDKFSPDWSDYNNCAIEPEMVIKIGADLRGENLSDEELIDGIDYVSPGIEIHNYRFWQSPPTVQELICSGGIHGGQIVGSEKVSPRELQFRDEEFFVYKNDELITSAPATEIMGGPLLSLRWLVNFLTAKGRSLEKDSLVIPGSPVELVEIDQDTNLRIEIERVGGVTAAFKMR